MHLKHSSTDFPWCCRGANVTEGKSWVKRVVLCRQKDAFGRGKNCPERTLDFRGKPKVICVTNSINSSGERGEREPSSVPCQLCLRNPEHPCHNSRFPQLCPPKRDTQQDLPHIKLSCSSSQPAHYLLLLAGNRMVKPGLRRSISGSCQTPSFLFQ